MNSEKVKEIKEALELNEYFAIEYFPKLGEPKIFTFTDLLTLINELEKENATKTDTIIDLLKKQEFYETEKLKQFAEMMKEKLKEKVNADNVDVFVECAKLSDETLKEFINE